MSLYVVTASNLNFCFSVRGNALSFAEQHPDCEFGYLRAGAIKVLRETYKQSPSKFIFKDPGAQMVLTGA